MIAVGTVSYPAAGFIVHLSDEQKIRLDNEVTDFCQQVTRSTVWQLSGFVEPRSSSDRLIRKGDLKLFSLWEGADELRPDEARLQHEFKRQKRSFEDFLRSKFGRKPRTYPNLVQLPELRSKMSVGSAADVG